MTNAQKRLLYILFDHVRSMPCDLFEDEDNTEELWDAMSELDSVINNEYK